VSDYYNNDEIFTESILRERARVYRKGICSSDRCRAGWGVAAKGYGVLGEFHGWESHGMHVYMVIIQCWWFASQ
jgi:hypothetical protein